MTATAWIALGMLIVASAITVWRTVRPASSVGDRAVAFDMLASLIQCSLFVGAVSVGDGLLVDLALVLGLLGFLSSVTVARFVERTGG
ncbi:MAG: monovalent cation/H+ antiporter complex subunit F [Actinomycetes bacterium]